MGLGLCPCGECTTDTGRSATCHSNCERYTNCRQKLNAINNAKKKQTDKEAILYSRKRKH